MASTNFSGSRDGVYYNNYNTIDNAWHSGPAMSTTGTLNANRSGGNIISGSVSATCYRPAGSYGFPVYISITSSSGGTISISNVSSGSSVRNSNSISTPSGGNWNASFNFTVDCGSATTISVVYECGQTGGCTQTQYGLRNNTLWFDKAYTAPSISYNSVTEIARIDDGKWVANYSVTGPNGANITDLGLDIMRNGTVLKNFSFGTQTGTRTSEFTISTSGTNITDGMSFETRMYVNDSSGNSIHNTNGNKTTRTYLKPVVKEVTDFNYVEFSPQDNKVLSWKTNSRMWSAYEEAFVTTITNNGDGTKALTDVPQGPDITNNTSIEATNSIQLTPTRINTLFSATERSVSVLHGTIRVARESYSPNPGYRYYVNTTVDIRYQPDKQVQQLSYNNGNISQGQTVIINDTPTVTVKFTYPFTVGAAGVASGYRIQIYSDSACTNLVTTKYCSNTISDNVHSGSVTINLSTEAQRGVLNYLRITPYYTCPDTSKGTIYGTSNSVLVVSFVKPVSRLNAPTIDYPISGETWHNHNYRICLTSPSDLDYNTYSSTIQNSYNYKDIELSISNGGTTTSYLYSQHPEIFSCSNLTYQQKIVINPSLITGVVTGTNYTIKIRFQKNYYDNNWGSWATFTLNIQAVNKQTLDKGRIISSQDITTVINNVIRLENVYPPTLTNTISKNRGDIIKINEYENLYDRILGIQNRVNNYATFASNKNDVKFTQTINALSEPNNPTNEYITSEDNPSDTEGRNYINILNNCMNQLF